MDESKTGLENSQPKKEKNKKSHLGLKDKLLVILIILITLTQFSVWGHQSVKYILGNIFNVDVQSTALDAGIGFLAMFASVMVFAGVLMFWKQNLNSKKYLIIGVMAFVLKNILDVFNEITLFSIRTAGEEKTMHQINDLAEGIGFEFFQFFFWVFILFYFKRKLKVLADKKQEL